MPWWRLRFQERFGQDLGEALLGQWRWVVVDVAVPVRGGGLTMCWVVSFPGNVTADVIVARKSGGGGGGWPW